MTGYVNQSKLLKYHNQLIVHKFVNFEHVYICSYKITELKIIHFFSLLHKILRIVNIFIHNLVYIYTTYNDDFFCSTNKKRIQ